MSWSVDTKLRPQQRLDKKWVKTNLQVQDWCLNFISQYFLVPLFKKIVIQPINCHSIIFSFIFVSPFFSFSRIFMKFYFVQGIFHRDDLSSLWNELVKEGEISVSHNDGLINTAGVLARKGNKNRISLKEILNLLQISYKKSHYFQLI